MKGVPNTGICLWSLHIVGIQEVLAEWNYNGEILTPEVSILPFLQPWGKMMNLLPFQAEIMYSGCGY